jgi:hypothetical protein
LRCDFVFILAAVVVIVAGYIKWMGRLNLAENSSAVARIILSPRHANVFEHDEQFICCRGAGINC